MDHGERLARIEQKIEHLSDLVSRFVEDQDEKNKTFFDVRDEVLKAQASARGAWWTVGLFGSLTVAVSGVVAWVVANFHFKG